MSPPCRVSAFPNDSSRVLPFYLPWNFRTDWVRVMFVSRCVTSKWSNIFKLSTRPCKLSQQYQEVDLDKIILSVGGRSWRPGNIFILGVQGAEWDRTEILWRGQAICRHKALNKTQNPQTLKFWKSDDFWSVACFLVMPVSKWMQTVEVKVNKENGLAGKLLWIFIQYFAILKLFQLENILAAIILEICLAEKLEVETQ